MTSRKKSSGFEFWSCVICAWPWCSGPPNFAQIALYPIRSYWHFPKSKTAASTSLDFQVMLCEFGHSGVLIVWYLCSVPNLVQISIIVTEIDTQCFKPSFDDVTRINFRFRLLVTLSSPRRRGASSHLIWCEISLSSPKLLTFFRNSRWRPGFSVHVNLAIAACW